MQQLTLPLQNSELVIRRSLRAKRLRVIVNQLGDVEVVVPGRASSQQVHEFIQQQQTWINQTQLYIQSQRQAHLDRDKPEKICLSAIDSCWDVYYKSGNINRYREDCGVTNQRRLCLTLSDESNAMLLMSTWLTCKAKQVLVPWLDKVSHETGLSYNKATIRGQKTRWGSCSARKNINLNRCLMFVEPRLVRYLMVHELCHTRYLDHSSKFWLLVQKFVPDYQMCEELLDKACYRLPKWAITN